MLVCEILCQSKCTVCELVSKKNSQISEFNTSFVHIKCTSDMAACYASVMHLVYSL